MRSLLDYINSNNLEEQLYWHIPLLYTSKSEGYLELQWRKNKESPWRFKLSNRDDWTHSSGDDIIIMLNKMHADLSAFEACLKSSILQQAVFANLIIKDVNKLLGEELVEKAIVDNDRFFKELKDVVEKLINNKEDKEPKNLDVKETSSGKSYDIPEENNLSSHKNNKKAPSCHLQLLKSK